MTAATEIMDNNIVTEYPLDDASAIYNAANRVTSFNSNSVGHDLNGNMTSFADGCGTTTYAWDSNSRLVSISGYSPDCSALAASFAYDALGRRIAKTINGETTKYLYDGADIVLEMNELNVATAYYIHGAGVDEPLARIELNADGTVKSIRFYLADALGSIIALTDENGTIKTQYNYTPFGEPEIIGEASDNPFMFTGREWDGATGLYYYRLRYQSPILGRFISEDPIGLAGGINMYAYTSNSPVNFVDPWGLAPGQPPIGPYPDPGPNGASGQIPLGIHISQYVPPWYDPDGPTQSTYWTINTGGAVCTATCGIGTKLMCFGLSGAAGFGTGGTGGHPTFMGCNFVTTLACHEICPSVFELKEGQSQKCRE